MKSHCRFVAVIVMFASGMIGGSGVSPVLARTGETPDPPAVQSVPERDVQDFVYLGDKRPVLIRFHVQIDGKPLVDAWEDFMAKLFAYLDHNGDGFLSKDEAMRAPPVQVLFNNAPNFLGLRRSVPEALDRDRDGKISRAELGDWYRRIGATPLQIHVVPVQNQLAYRVTGNPNEQLLAENFNERLFSLFDADRDGKLSRAELERAPKILHKFDLNEDELVSIQELSEYLASDEGTLASSLVFSRNGPGVNGPLIPLESSEMKKDLAQSGPDLEFRVYLGEETHRQSGVELIRVKEQPSPISKSVRTTFGGTLVLELGPTRIEMGCGESASEPRIALQHLRRQYRAQFLRADLDSSGYLDGNEAMQIPLFRNTFRLMDRDGDGKLYEREVVAYLDKMRALQEAAVRSCVTLAVTDQGQGLFDLVDADKDGRISVREMRRMARLIDELDRDGDGRISRGEIPHRYRVTMRSGPELGYSFAESVKIERLRILNNQPDLPQRSGPLWFQKMDRNRDGEVSRREFLGTDEAFRKIDHNGDGFISIEEANRADRMFRKEKKSGNRDAPQRDSGK